MNSANTITIINNSPNNVCLGKALKSSKNPKPEYLKCNFSMRIAKSDSKKINLPRIIAITKINVFR